MKTCFCFCTRSIHLEVSRHRGTASSHPFLDGIFHCESTIQRSRGIPIIIYGNPHLAEPLCNCNVASPSAFSSALFVAGSPSLEMLEGTAFPNMLIYGGFHSHEGTQKWLVYNIMEHPTKMDG